MLSCSTITPRLFLHFGTHSGQMDVHNQDIKTIKDNPELFLIKTIAQQFCSRPCGREELEKSWHRKERFCLGSGKTIIYIFVRQAWGHCCRLAGSKFPSTKYQSDYWTHNNANNPLNDRTVTKCIDNFIVDATVCR